MKSLSLSRRLGLLCGLTLLFTAGLSSEAAAVPIIINTGEDIFEAGPLPGELAKQGEAAGWKAGYKCSVFGVLWAYLYWWDCKAVAYDGESYDDSEATSSAVAAAYSADDVKIAFWAKNGRWVIGAGLVALVLGGLLLGRGGDDDEDKEVKSDDDSA